MELTLGAMLPRAERRRAGWRVRARRRPRPRAAPLLSVDDLLRYRLLERLAEARRGPWGAGPAPAPPPPPPPALTPGYELLELRAMDRGAPGGWDTPGGWDAPGGPPGGPGGPGAAAGAGWALLALAALALAVRALRRYFSRWVDKQQPAEERVVASPGAPPAEPPPRYSERAAPAPQPQPQPEPREEPPPPYSACYVAVSDPEGAPCYKQRPRPCDGAPDDSQRSIELPSRARGDHQIVA